MLIVVDPSSEGTGLPASAISATITPGIAELGILEVVAHALDDDAGVRPGNAQVELVALARECQRAPVNRTDINKQNPIACHAGPTREASQKRRCGWRDGDALHCAPASR